MTPLQIINGKFIEKCQSLRHFHQMYQNALFRPTTTASEWEIQEEARWQRQKHHFMQHR